MPVFDSYRVGNGQSASCCIARIIRRILCISTALPSSPFDRFHEDVKDPMATPGLMARLMGLESVPPENPVRKSRSQKTRKRVIPMYQEFEDENFFILSFDRGDRNVDCPVEWWKSGSCYVKERAGNRKKQRRRRRHSNKENLDADKMVCEVRIRNSSNVRRNFKNSSQDSNGAGKVMESLAVLKLKAEANSENSSPNSVLDCFQFPPDHHKVSSNSGHEDFRLAKLKSRRTLSDELESLKLKELEQMNDDSVQDQEEKQNRLRDSEPHCPEKWGGISKLAAMDVYKSTWFESGTSKIHHMEEVGKDLASGILDHLLCELLTELKL